ncbi:hypothetical protein L1987_21514 [Smallanthus sonchifolius]|uniref:Uncharacterized protein n=1 Tax=Smallanthus sonchifolius TaxID=185202 RepID=A0ACB9IVS6_9ASTR|nr:hypothetical protein L1987_21514 [Smallanthus sonchifolius]
MNPSPGKRFRFTMPLIPFQFLEEERERGRKKKRGKAQVSEIYFRVFGNAKGSDLSWELDNLVVESVDKNVSFEAEMETTIVDDDDDDDDDDKGELRIYVRKEEDEVAHKKLLKWANALTNDFTLNLTLFSKPLLQSR